MIASQIAHPLWNSEQQGSLGHCLPCSLLSQQLELPRLASCTTLFEAHFPLNSLGSCSPADTLKSGATLKGRYTIIDTLGAGSNAITYKATDSETGNQVLWEGRGVCGVGVAVGY